MTTSSGDADAEADARPQTAPVPRASNSTSKANVRGPRVLIRHRSGPHPAVGLAPLRPRGDRSISEGTQTIAVQEFPLHVAPSAGTCPECGSRVRPGRRFCSQACHIVWWKEHVQRRFSVLGNNTLAQLRAEGRDPSHGVEAARKRAVAVSRIKRQEWMTLSTKQRKRRTQPATLARWAKRASPAGRQ